MARIQSLEGRAAGILGTTIQAVFRLLLGQPINPAKVQAHAPRVLLTSFLSNALLGSGRTRVERQLLQLVRIRAAARNGCPF
jgi:alkylhydroperoxidase family enzyme